MNPYEKLIAAQFGRYYLPNNVQPVNVRFNNEQNDPFLAEKHEGRRTYNIDGYVNPRFNDQIPLPIRFNENIRGTNIEPTVLAHEFLHGEESGRLARDIPEMITPDFDKSYQQSDLPINPSKPNVYSSMVADGPVVRMHGGPYYPADEEGYDLIAQQQMASRKKESARQIADMTPYQKLMKKDQEKMLGPSLDL